MMEVSRMNVNRIFYSIQGEGVYQGLPTMFIRLAGCNLIPKCSFCDTSYAWDPKDGKNMSIEDILKEVAHLCPYHKPWICITGGEPLWQEEELEKLVRELGISGHPITIETNGSFKPPRWYTLVDSWNADMKCPSSGVCGTSNEVWFSTRQQDQIKFVVGTMEDLDFTREVVLKHRTDGPQILVSPMTGLLVDKVGGKVEEYWNKEWLQEVAEFCKEIGARYSLQLHKLIWGDKRGV